MRWLITTVFVSSLVVMACDATGSNTSGGGGEGGEAQWGNSGGGTPGMVLTSVAASSSSGAAQGASSSSGGGSTCDNSGSCQNCQNCAFNQLCGAEANACFSDMACNSLGQCLNGCSDQTCANNCASMYSAGVAKYNAMVDCILCQGCYSDCNGAAAGC